GGFRFSNTTPATHMRAAELLKSGIDASEINRLLFENLSEKEVAVRRTAYSSVNIYDGRIAAVTITKAERELCGADMNDISCAIDVPRGIRGVEAAALIKESDSENEYRISLRSNTDLDVSAVAGTFGGGGHIRAAGASLIAHSPEEAEKTVVDAIRKQMAAQGMM
ncbi:MAG: bifunctional oligoribonuclease/PAP phosphatase NrnA, partial [Clostridia bacterium]|nr:bifunctional oligoribonuclease/PAP phosphatase NrnA [Clostridia bacterium]